ncbi:hypothetical protein EU528_11145 [Candidatus Thorarchaeota archaeon]|nr:MAG: hypothetical protein EU528_11145 [Candidatus Thorarchaeota archaeon]
MKRRIGLLSAFALALFMMSVFLPISTITGNTTDIQMRNSMNQPSVVASETGLEGSNSPLSMLVYTEFIDTVPNVDHNEFRNTIDSIEETYGYWFNYDNLTDYTELGSHIWAYDVFLIPEQEQIYQDNVSSLVPVWSPFISDWVNAGGIIIMMDYVSDEAIDAPLIPIYNETGLMNIEGIINLTNDPITLTSANDSLARGIEGGPILGPNGAFGYNTTQSVQAFTDGDYAWTSHRVLGRGHVVLLGFDNFNRYVYSDIVLANALRLHQHVVIDNSHTQGLNPYTDSVNYTNDLLDAGFAVSIMDSWSESLINSADVLILSWAGTIYNESQVNFVEEWVSSGGGLFVLSEFGPFGNNLDPITDRFGFMRNSTCIISDSDDWEDYDRYVIYESENIANHSVTLWTSRIELAGGAAFDSIPENAVPIIVSDIDSTAGWYNESYLYVGQWNGSISAAVAPYGMGRISVVLDTSIIDNLWDYNNDGLANYFEHENDFFAVNNVRWLFGAGIEEKIVLFEESNSPADYANGWYHDFSVMLTLNGFTVKWESAFYEELINQADVVFIADGIFNYTAPEIAILSNYVHDGGSLFLVGDQLTFSEQINPIANEFGLVYNTTAGCVQESNNYEFDTRYIVYNQSNFAMHPIMEGVNRMEFDLCSAFQSIGTGTALVVADDDGTATWSVAATSIDGLAIAAATTAGKGRVVAITDVNLPMTDYDPEADGYGNMLDSDNDVFLNNAFIWLTANRAPGVEVSSPNGGETVDGEITVSWTGVDLDDDALTYSVFYSDNLGGTWTSLGTGLSVTEVQWNTTLVANGQEYLIRVIASDGEFTVDDVSDGNFTVDNPSATTTPTGTGIPIDTTTIIIIIIVAGVVIVIIIIIMKKKK